MEEERDRRNTSNSISSNRSERSDSRTQEIELKIAIIGLTNTGKSSIIHTYIYQEFPDPEKIKSTIEDKYSTPIKIEGMYCKLNIMDTSGDKTYDFMFDQWVIENDGFILTYSFDNKESFNEVKIKYEQIKKLKHENHDYSIIVVGNKGELKNEEKVVTKEEVNKFCKSKELDNLECSALKNINIKEIIYLISERMLQKKYPEAFGIEDEDVKQCYCI